MTTFRQLLAHTTRTLGYASISVLLSCGCEVIRGSGHVVTERRDVDEFSALVLEGEGEVRFTQSSKEQLVIEAEDNLIDELITSVQGDSLVIKTRDRVILDATKPILYHIAARDLHSIRVQGSTAFEATELATDTLHIDIYGSTKLTVDELDAQTLSTEISGSGNVRLAGKVRNQRVDISGSGAYRARALESRKARVDLSGSGNVEIFATDTLDVDISGSGEVGVRGKPKTTVDISGSGDIGSID